MAQSEKIRRIESLSWRCLLVSLVCNSIWTSYAFKVQSIEIAIINVIGLLANVLLLTIYLIVKPEQNLMTQFFGVMVVCQIFNFDTFNFYICGYLGIFCSTLMSVIPLSQIPEIIETRCTQKLNIYSLCLQYANAFVWSIWSFETSHYFFMFSLSICMLCLKI